MLTYLLKQNRTQCVSETTFSKDTFFGGKESRNRKAMRRYLLFLFSCVCFTGVYAQQSINWCTNPPPQAAQGGFKVNGTNGTVKGCAFQNNGFEVTVEGTVANDSYVFDYKGGDPIQNGGLTNVKKFKYFKQGTYQILQFASNGTGSIACQTVEVYYPPNFTVRACSGRQVQVTIPDDSTAQRYDEFRIDWGDGTTSLVSKSSNMKSLHAYSSAISTANVLVSGLVGGEVVGGCVKPSAGIALNTTPLSSVAIRKVTVRDNGTVAILVRGTQGAAAEVEVSENNGTYRSSGQLMTTNDTTTVIVSNINALNNDYCFRLSTKDGCENTSTQLSNVVCATNLEVTAQNRQNELKWKQYPTDPNFLGYRIVRNASIAQVIPSVATTTQIDANVVCGEQYCYQLVVQLSGGVESVSPLKCVKAISNIIPSVVRTPSVSVDESTQKIHVISTSPTSGITNSYKLVYLRSDDGGNNFKEIATQSNSFLYIDNEANPAQQSYCYKIQYENACGNRSEPTPPLCSVYLTSKTTSTVDWTSQSPFVVQVNQYELEILDEQGVLVDQVPVGGNLSYNPEVYNPDQQLFRYRIIAYPQGGAGASYSNFFVFQREATVFVPDAFSPNDDNINDKFAPKGQFLDTSKLIIYNRWGQPLFETNNAFDGWDGKINGQPASEGTYIYRIEIKDSLGKGFVKTGTLLLAR